MGMGFVTYKLQQVAAVAFEAVCGQTFFDSGVNQELVYSVSAAVWRDFSGKVFIPSPFRVSLGGAESGFIAVR
jgi:hypothetical protein